MILLFLALSARAGEAVSDQGLVDIVDVACERYPDEVRVVARGGAREARGLLRDSCAPVRSAVRHVDIGGVVPWHSRHARCVVLAEPYYDGWWVHAWCRRSLELTMVEKEPERPLRAPVLVDDEGLVEVVDGTCDRPGRDVRVVVAGPAGGMREVLDDTCARVRRVHRTASTHWVHQWQARRARCVFFVKPGEVQSRVRQWCYADQPPVYSWSRGVHEGREYLYRHRSAQPPTRTVEASTDDGKGQ